MTKMIDPSDPATAELFERVDPTINATNEYERSHPFVAQGCESSEGLQTDPNGLSHWKPIEPQFCRDIATYYKVSKRTIQNWFVDLLEIAPWFSEAELRLDDDRYSPLAVDLLGDRHFAGSKKKWKDILAERFADQIESQQPTPTIQPDVLPPQTEEVNPAGRYAGLSLHIGSTPTMPSIPGLIPVGNDADYLVRMQQRFAEFEQLQHQVIAQMQSQYEQTQTLNAQYQEAISLSDRLLLHEYQLKGVQLGYTALHVKQEAFKSTVQAAESGSLPVPGKPEIESAQPSSV